MHCNKVKQIREKTQIEGLWYTNLKKTAPKLPESSHATSKSHTKYYRLNLSLIITFIKQFRYFYDLSVFLRFRYQMSGGCLAQPKDWL